MSLQTITVSPVQPSVFARALVAAEAVGDMYRVVVDNQDDLKPKRQASIVRLTLEDWDDLLGNIHERVSRMEYRMLVMFMLGHASTRNDDVAVRRELMSWLLPEDERREVWAGREARSAWSRAAMGEALAVQSFYRDLAGGLECPLDIAAVEVATSAQARLLPYLPYLTAWEWEQALAVVCTTGDEWADSYVAAVVRAHMAFVWSGGTSGKAAVA